MTWHDWMTLFSIFMAGLWDGNGTVIRDGVPSMLMVWFGKYPWFVRMYYGTNADYNPSNIFTANVWHKNKFLLIYSYCAAVAFQVWKIHGWKWGVGSFLLLQAVEGTSFRYFYGYFFREHPAGNFWHFIRTTFNIFGNNHRKG